MIGKIYLALIMGLICSYSFAVEYKAFWRCADNHLEALEAHGELAGEEIHYYISYNFADESQWHSFPLTLKSTVDFPASFEHEDFVMLGGKKGGLMNCIGQVVVPNHSPQGKLVFDVRRNAYSCPLIPKGCDENTKS